MRSEQHIGLKTGSELQHSIADHPFFAGFGAERLAEIIRGAREVAFDAGQVLFREDEPASRFFLIKEGEVAIESRLPPDRALVIQSVGARDVLGWSWLVAPYRWHFTARAIKPTKAIAIDGAHLLVACEKDPAFGYELLKRTLKIVLERLHSTRARFAESAARSSSGA